MEVGTPCEERDGIIWFQQFPLCASTSYNAHQYFARNDDGQGKRRGELTQAILNQLETHDDEHQARWDKVWEDELCQQYRRKEIADHWIWNHEFYNAEIVTLWYIAGLVGAKVEK